MRIGLTALGVPSLESPMAAGTTAITFDDGPHPEGTFAVLDVLDRLGWPATFFMLGEEAARFPEVAREVTNRGHTVGLHGDCHRYLLTRTPRATWTDLRKAADVVAEAVGSTPRWWRPPYGVLTTAGLVAARSHGLRPLLWSAWGKDWRHDATAETITRTVSRGRLDGGTVLLHDSDATTAPGTWKRVADALPLIAEHLAVEGLRVAPLPPVMASAQSTTLPDRAAYESTQ